MGLFDFLKKAKSNNNPFSSFLSLDLPVLLEKSEIFHTHIVDGKFNSVEYECSLDNLVLRTFDTIRIRIGSEEKKLSSESPLILTFLRKEGAASSEQAQYVVNSVMKTCEKEDLFTEFDETHFNSGTWRGRTVIRGTRLVSIDLDEKDGITLWISEYEKFL